VSSTDWIVIAIGALTIGWVNWYFFVAKGRVAIAATVAGAQEVAILVHGGYEPPIVRVKAGAPLRLVFDRQETSSCSEEIVFGDFGVRRFLPAFEKTTIELDPKKAGTYEFTCGMGMLRGQLIVE
jgi:plastocyanin domain-containing protein